MKRCDVALNKGSGRMFFRPPPSPYDWLMVRISRLAPVTPPRLNGTSPSIFVYSVEKVQSTNDTYLQAWKSSLNAAPAGR